ncbi:DUF362 domain-containing protein [bacterium]|nr:DUF362 domain-containing protein [bacterium]
MIKSKVAVLKTKPGTVVEDYSRLLDLLDYTKVLSPESDTLLKLNLSWTKYYPACSSQPWQVHGVIRKLLKDGFAADRLLAVENKTVVTDPMKGARNNKWLPILQRYEVKYIPLPGVNWIKYDFKSKLTILPKIFPEGIVIPEMFIGKNIIHFPTVKTHGHSTTTGSIKNSFGGLLREVRHYCHKYIHETLLDLMIIQKEIHPVVFAVMDGTVAGDGAGPRTMEPKVKNYILASFDQVAIDAVAAKMMGFNPMNIGYIRMCHDRKLGVGDPSEIGIVGEDISNVNFGFKTKRSFVIWGDQMLRKGCLKFLEKAALHSPLVFWAPLASNIYHDFIWYPIIGYPKIEKFFDTEWGKLFLKY